MPCSPCGIPPNGLSAAWTKGSGSVVPPSGSGTITYYPGGLPSDTTGIFGGPSWQYYPPPPTAGDQQGVWVRATCFDGAFFVGLAALISSESTLACGSNPTPCWVVNHSLFGSTFNCLVIDTVTCSPFSLHFHVSNVASGCSGATTWFDDLTITGSSAFNDSEFTCCDQCPIPRADLTLTIGGSPTTLAYASGGPDWSDGTHTLSCEGGIVTLSGGGTWTKVGAATTCSPYHVEFTSGATTAYVDE